MENIVTNIYVYKKGFQTGFDSKRYDITILYPLIS